jgi:hypothetical protein
MITLGEPPEHMSNFLYVYAVPSVQMTFFEITEVR